MDLIGGRWELRDPIASGGSATVWRAFDHRLGTECAAKVLRHRDAGHIIRFAREQSRRLEGPHVVAPYAWVADDGTALIASELVSGGSLASLIGDYGALSDGTVVAILDQLLDALNDVHGAGIVHRDVKPGNVLLRATGTGPIDVALTDFGIAIAATDARLTTAGMVIGTPGYVPPEVMRGHSGPEMSHDLYAMGWLAMVLILGREGGAREEALADVADPVLARALERLTDPVAQARPRRVEDVRVLLEGALRDAVPRDREGEPIVIFDQLPGGDHGTNPLSGAEGLPTMPSPQMRSGTEVAWPAGMQPEATRGYSPATQSENTRASFVQSRPPRGNRRKHIMQVVLAVAVLIAGIVIATILWPTGDNPGDDTSPDSSQTNVTELATLRPELGDACSWQMEGDEATSPDGTALACQLTDGGYSWQPR